MSTLAKCAYCHAPESRPHLNYCYTRSLDHDAAPPDTSGKVSDPVNHPSHYNWLNGIEVIDITENLGFCLGNVVKYVLRADHKGKPIEDLRKARFYLDRELSRRGYTED